MDYGNMFGKRTGFLRIGSFYGINQAVGEGELAATMMSRQACFTPRGVNFDIRDGNLCVRNNYESVTGQGIATALNDGCTYKIRRLFKHAPPDGTAYLLAAVEAWKGYPLALDHCCLMHRRWDLSDTWAEVKCAEKHSMGDKGDKWWFRSAEFDFVNYSGDFFETDAEYFATVMVNGVDLPVFYAQTNPSTTSENPTGNNRLSVLGSAGWRPVTARASSDKFTPCTGFSNDDAVEFHSHVLSISDKNLVEGQIYYVANADGSTFQVKDSKGNIVNFGTSIAETSLSARVIKDYGAWNNVTPNYKAGTFKCAALAHNGYRVMFKSTSSKMPSGIQASTVYIVCGASGEMWNVYPYGKTEAETVVFTSNGVGVQARTVKSYPADAPLGRGLVINKDRLFLFNGDKIYYGAGEYDNLSTSAVRVLPRPNDWSTTLYAGNVVQPTWDGEVFTALRELGGQAFALKPHSFFTVDGVQPPFGLSQKFSAAGTIAPESLCWHPLVGVFYATPKGLHRYNNANSQAYAADEIKGIWRDESACKAAVVGDRLFLGGRFCNPETGAQENALLVIDVLTKNIMYWDMALGDDTLSVDCILDPRFTADSAGAPELWFASGDIIYKYSPDEPGAGQAPHMTYWLPGNDFGAAGARKRVTKLTVAGDGGMLTVTPYSQGLAWPARTFELPAKLPRALSVGGKEIAFRLASDGDPVVVKGIEQRFS